MNEIIKKPINLPSKLQDLTKFVLIGREKLVSVRAEIRAINKLDLAQDVKNQKQKEAQDLAGALLDAEVKIGEILKTQNPKSLRDDFGRTKQSLPAGITKNQSSQFQLMAEHRELVEQVKAEAKDNDDLPTRTEVLRKVAQKKNQEEIKKIEQSAITDFTGKYDVVVIDPAWQVEKIERDVSPTQVGLDYPTMSVEEISNFKIPAKDNCHLFLWTTHKFLPDSFEILKEWGFKYVCCMVWHKNGGFQPFNLPQYNCEFVLYSRKGTPKFKETKNFFTCFSANRTRHSEKPEEFYNLLRRITVGKRIDIFNRRKIEGFDRYGNEAK